MVPDCITTVMYALSISQEAPCVVHAVRHREGRQDARGP